MTDNDIRILVNRGVAMADRYTFLFPDISNLEKAVALRDELQSKGNYYDFVERVRMWIDLEPKRDNIDFYKTFFIEMRRSLQTLEKNKVRLA